MRRHFIYCLVRYMPDRGAGERINVGVVLFDPLSRLLDVALDERGAALVCAFNGFSLKGYKVWASDFRSAIRHVGLRWNQRLPLEDDEAPALSSLLNEAQASWGSSVEASEERRVAAYASPRHVLEDLYERYVASQRPEGGRGRPQFSESKIWETFHSALRRQRLGPYIASISVDMKDMKPLVFEHSIRVEGWRALQPVSFDLLDEESIKGKAARWAGLTSRMARRDDLEGIVYLVAPPKPPDLYAEYEAAVEWLRDTEYSRAVVDVKHAPDLAVSLHADLEELGLTQPEQLKVVGPKEPQKLSRSVQALPPSIEVRRVKKGETL